MTVMYENGNGNTACEKLAKRAVWKSELAKLSHSE